MGCLYLITSPSGKQYIGITMQTLHARWRAHKANAKRSETGYLQAAIRKYGSDAMICRELVISNDHEYLKDLEQRAIRAFGSKAPNGYNLTDGGDGVIGVVVTDAGRARRSAAQKLSFADPARRERHRQSQRTAEVRVARSESQKRRMADPEVVARLRESLKAAFSRSDVVAKIKSRPKRQVIDDGLSKSERHRQKNVAAYRERKNAYAKTDLQRQKRTEYMRKWREANRDRFNAMCRESQKRSRDKAKEES